MKNALDNWSCKCTGCIINTLMNCSSYSDLCFKDIYQLTKSYGCKASIFMDINRNICADFMCKKAILLQIYGREIGKKSVNLSIKAAETN